MATTENCESVLNQCIQTPMKDKLEEILGFRQPSYSKCCNSLKSYCRAHLSAFWGLTSAAKLISGQCVFFASHTSKGKVHLDVLVRLDSWHCCCQVSTSFTDYPAMNDTLILSWEMLVLECIQLSPMSRPSALSTEWWSTFSWSGRSFWSFRRSVFFTEWLWCAG